MTSAAVSSDLRVRAVRARAVSVPLDPPISTASGHVTAAPLVLIDLETDGGVTGRAYIFTYSPVALEPARQLVEHIGLLVGGDALAPFELDRKLQSRFRLLGAQGLIGMALAGIDMAAWDALAKAHGAPLARVLGGGLEPVPAYGSLRAVTSAGIAAEAGGFRALGFTTMKIKVGMADLAADLRQIDALRDAAGPNATLMIDYNQSLTVAEALRRGRELEALGLGWIEEPVRFTDNDGHAAIARDLRTPIQIGENWWGVSDMAKSIAANASDFVMLDVMKIGGVTGWLRAAALADAHALPLSAHLFCEISAHLMAVTPTAALLEYLDIAGPVLNEPVRVDAGRIAISDSPGTGIEWNEDAVARFAAGATA